MKQGNEAFCYPTIIESVKALLFIISPKSQKEDKTCKVLILRRKSEMKKGKIAGSWDERKTNNLPVFHV
ncbi:MAG: hypothetical protein ACK5BV_04115 [Bacteroidota bacterium]|jgi:hypothetical protein